MPNIEMDHEEREAFCQAVRDTLEALNALYVADFDADDSGAVEHVVGPQSPAPTRRRG